MTGSSLRFTKVYLLNGDMRQEATEYIRGLNMRSESRSRPGLSETTPTNNLRYEYGPLRTHIFNRDLNYRFEIDLATRTYAAFRVNEQGNLVWVKPQRVKPAKLSGKTVHNFLETIDTGERRELFGYAARRVVTKTRQIRDSETLSESERDGWYIDPPAAWEKLHPPLKPGSFCYITSGSGLRDYYKFTEVGQRETGFALLATRTHKSSCRNESGNLRTHENVHREEVTAFSEGPLAANLFVPPADFERVPQLLDEARHTLAHRARLRWEIWKDSLSLPKRLEKFSADPQ